MSLDTDAHMLIALPVFNLLEREAVRLLAFQAEKEDYSAGDMLINFGEKAAGGLVLLQGSVSVTPPTGDSGMSQKHCRILAQGALIGQLALITDVTHRITAQALEATTVMKISRNSFQRILREYPDCAAKIRAAIARDLLDFTKELGTTRRAPA